MKNKIKYLAFILLALGVMKTSVKAYNIYNFNGTANSNWAYVTEKNKSYIRSVSTNYYGVKWTFSNKSSHKMWFRIINSNGSSRGSACLDYLSNGTIETNAEKNHYYWLQARREYIIDPSTTVSGQWHL